MAINYTWVIDQLDAYPTYEGQTDVVFTVHWRLNADDGNGHSASAYGTIGVTYDAGSPFVPYDQLTQDQVVGWVKAAMTGGGKRNSWQELEASLALQIETQINPPTVTPTLPWAS